MIETILILGGTVFVLGLVAFVFFFIRPRQADSVGELLARERHEMKLDADLNQHLTMIDRVAARRAAQNPLPNNNQPQ